MKKITILFFLFSNLIICSTELSFWGTSNIFESADIYPDIGIEFYSDYQNDFNNSYFDTYIGLYLPLINYYMMQIPTGILYGYNFIDNYNQILSQDFFMDAYIYFNDYNENNLFIPGYSLYYKYYFNNALIKTENIIFADIYPFTNFMNNIKDIIKIKGLYSIRNFTFNLSINTGYKRNINNENIKAYTFSIQPLLSIGIKDKTGISVSLLYKNILTDSLPYYLDDSFIDDFYYDIIGISGKFTYLLETGKIVFSGKYNIKNYCNMYDIVLTDYSDLYSINFFNDNREDKEIIMTVYLENINNITLGFLYEYEKNISTNSFYNFVEHSFSITYKY